MKFHVTATPKQVPLLDLQSLKRTTEWHQQHENLGCIMLIQGTNCLAGMLEAASETELHRALDSYPDKGCYDWKVETATPMGDACARDMKTRTTPRAAIPTEPGMPGTVFPGWMTGNSRH